MIGPITILEGASKQKERGTTPSESAPHNETYASNSSSTASQKTSSKGSRSLSPRARQENAIKALLRRARRNGHAGTVSATDYEMEAVQALLLPAAISHARSNAKKLPQYAVLCGCRVFLSTSLAGEVFVYTDRGGFPIAASRPFRA